MTPDVTPTETADQTPIDAVITWVNGDAPGHRRDRAAYAARTKEPLHENAANPHRWSDNDEIRFCLRSIAHHAPWIRWIWIVTNGAQPDLTWAPEPLRAKIKFVTHTQIFDGYSQALPTFNSLAIETVLWRISGLSERFLYFNDDVFLSAPITPADVFHGPSPVLRGRWVDLSAIDDDPQARADPARFHDFMQLNAARLMGVPARSVFAAAHVVHPFRRSVMAQLFDQHRAAFEANMRHRFRDLSQFFPAALFSHACINAQQVQFQTQKDHLHIYSGQGSGEDAHAFRASLQAALRAGPKFLCVNDLPQLQHLIPEVRDWIEAAIAGGGPG